MIEPLSIGALIGAMSSCFDSGYDSFTTSDSHFSVVCVEISLWEKIFLILESFPIDNTGYSGASFLIIWNDYRCPTIRPFALR